MTRQLIGAEEVAEITGMSKYYSFKLIKTLNAELERFKDNKQIQISLDLTLKELKFGMMI